MSARPDGGRALNEPEPLTFQARGQDSSQVYHYTNLSGDPAFLIARFEAFAAAGFEVAAQSTVAQHVAPNWPTYADKIALRADSFVARLADAEFRTGLAEMRRYAAAANLDVPVTVNLDLFVFRRR